jgi:excinuclease ABC subunit C
MSAIDRKLEQQIREAPQDPGVYRFFDANGTLLYIGKAQNLNARLKSYVRVDTLPPQKQRMMERARTVKIEIRRSEIDALIRESELIKTHRPPFNVLMRDDKNYTYIAITKEDFPRIFVTHQPIDILKKTTTARGVKVKNVPSELIGPFTDGLIIRMVVRMLRKIFPYCTCAPHKRHSRACINAQIRKCPGTCCAPLTGNSTAVEKKAYLVNIQRIRAVLLGRHARLKSILEKEMKRASSAREYERARILRDQIHGLDRIFAHKEYIHRDIMTDRAKALRVLMDLLKLSDPPVRIEGYDISNIQGTHPVGSMVVFINGRPAKDQYRRFSIKTIQGANDPAMMKEVILRRLHHTDWGTPDVLLMDGGITQLGAAIAAATKAGVSVPMISIAKKEEKLFRPDALPKKLSEISPDLLRLLQHVRDEAHRFAITYHRSKRSKNLIKKSAQRSKDSPGTL